MQRRCNLTHFILAGVAALGLTPLVAVVDAQARIAFMSDRDWNWEIYVMDADGSNLRSLTNHPNDDEDPAWYAPVFFRLLLHVRPTRYGDGSSRLTNEE